MINGVLRLADRSVRSVMTPRVEVMWLDLDDPPETIRREIAESEHSRYPAGRKGLDELAGIVHTKHLLDQVVRTGRLDIAALAQASRSSCTRRRRCSACSRCSARTRSTWRWWSTNTASSKGS